MLFGILEIELKQWAFYWEICCRTEKVDRCTAEITELGCHPDAEGAKQNSRRKLKPTRLLSSLLLTCFPFLSFPAVHVTFDPIL